MGLESATYINGLVNTNPVGGDSKSQGDDHIRLIKATLLSTFPNITGAMTVTHTELNNLQSRLGGKVVGTAANNLVALDGSAKLPAVDGSQLTNVLTFQSAVTKLLFCSAIPSGWTVDGTLNDKVVMVNSASIGTTGGSWTVSGLTADAHTHNTDMAGLVLGGPSTQYLGGTGAHFVGDFDHAHTSTSVLTSTAASANGISSSGAWRPAYVNAAWATKN